jgi:tryptophan synthase alpha subunit
VVIVTGCRDRKPASLENVRRVREAVPETPCGRLGRGASQAKALAALCDAVIVGLDQAGRRLATTRGEGARGPLKEALAAA